MEKNNEFCLIGHLQVMEEPLASLYKENSTGRFYLFERTFEVEIEDTYVLSEVTPLTVLKYMNGEIQLKTIFLNHTTYYYHHDGDSMSSNKFRQISTEALAQKLESSSSCDTYKPVLAHRSAALKRMLKSYIAL